MGAHRESRQTVGLLVALVLIASASIVSAQPKYLTLDNIFDPGRHVNFTDHLPRVLIWLDDEHYLQAAESPSVAPLLRVDAVTGGSVPFFDPDLMEAALNNVPGVSGDDARRLAWSSAHLMNVSQTAVVIDHDNDLYYYEFGASQAHRLTRSPEPEEEVSFSPNGALVAFVRNHNLIVFNVEHGVEHTLTTDGSPTVRNGVLDWVYQEEIYGRGNFRGYWWSPDSARVAYLRLDDSRVPVYTVLDPIPYQQVVEEWTYAYPKAGDPNPAVQLGIVTASGGGTTWVDIEAYVPDEPLIVNVAWSTDGKQVVYQVQNREQTWLDLNLADSTGSTTRVLRETSEAWVNFAGPPTWLGDGSFLWRSERSGWMHLYHYERNGTLRRQVTDGPWEVRELHGVDETTGWVYFSGTERRHIGSDIYRVRLDGAELTRLSKARGTHRARFNPSLSRYIDDLSNISTPPSMRLHAADGTETRVIDIPDATVLDAYRLVEPEFMQVATRDGFTMEAMMFRPPHFDPSRRYPVYQHVYGGPHLQRVRDAWVGSTYMFWQLLAQHGVIVWVLDNRTASGKGAVSTWPVYQNFGELELQDIEDGIAWLRAKPYVDASRIGIEGWSYGGFMVSYALTHSQSFAMGIAGGSVTDWRDYDTIYTERYMRRPQNNAAGYARSSPRFKAHDLHGALLLIHGAMDKNVHIQNTLQFAHALQQAGKPFDMMIYPRSRHRLGSYKLEKHRHAIMLDFILRHLRPDARRVAAVSTQQNN